MAEEIKKIKPIKGIIPKYYAQKCVTCNGYTTVKHGELECPTCKGEGYVIIPTGENGSDN